MANAARGGVGWRCDSTGVTCLMSHLFGLRSPFTAVRSAGVRASTMRLAELMGTSEDESLRMSIVGDLHDLGKARLSA